MKLGGCLILVVILLGTVIGVVVSGGFANSKEVCWSDGACEIVKPAGIAEDRRPDTEYDLVVGNVVLGLLFSETLFVPIYLGGWYLWEPVGPKVEKTYHPVEPAPQG